VAAAIAVAAAIGVAGFANAAFSGGPSHHQHDAGSTRGVVAEGAPQSGADAATPITSPPGAAARRTDQTSTRSTPTTMAPPDDVNLSNLPTSGPEVPHPTSVSIPSIGVKTSLIELGQNADGTAQVPATTNVAGWYDKGPAPGQRGPAVILGHVDSISGPGVFFHLKDLVPGAAVDVAEGQDTLHFTVQQVAVYTKAAFPTEAVFGSTPIRALRLVTCGGPFDYATGHYYDNVVVYAVET
jgi:sortase (surface protein transpeptidase)